MMAALKVMTYFKVSLSTHNWDKAIKKGPRTGALSQALAGAYSAAMRASIYAKARSMRARTRSLPTSAITASMPGD